MSGVVQYGNCYWTSSSKKVKYVDGEWIFWNKSIDYV